MIWIPKFKYPATTGTNLTLTLPQHEWKANETTVGGYRDSAALVRASRTISRTHGLDITLRVYESEMAAVRALIEWMQDNPATAATWWPDVDVTGTSYPVLLLAPAQGEKIAFNDTDFPLVKDVPLTIRHASNTAWNLAYWI